MIRKPFRLMLCILFSIAILTACTAPTPMATVTPIPPTPTLAPTNTPIPSTPTLLPTVIPISPTPNTIQPELVVKPGSISGMVDIGGRSLYIICMGEGSPTVIFESGTGTDHSYWISALIEVSKHTMACAYDRADLGKSDPATTLPRTTQDMVDDVHSLLANASIPGPYILVGHSMGAYIIRLFTSQYPQDVVGLVFIDSYTPGLYESYCAALTESTDESASFKRARTDCQVILAPVSDWTQVDEGFDDVTSQIQVRNTGPYGDLPLVVLAAQYSISGGTGADKLKGEMWGQAQRGLADLSTQGQFFVVQKVNHSSITASQAVSNAIIEMVDTLQSK